MKLFIISCLFLLTFINTVNAQDGPCDPYAPYYMRTETGPGALLADIFFFTMSAPVAIAVVGGPKRTVINKRTKERRRVSTAACLPITTARHFIENRPVHIEHWRED